MSLLSVGDFCVKVIAGGGFQTATIQRVEESTEEHVKLEGSRILYDPVNLAEKELLIPGFYSHLICFDDGEEDRWYLHDHV